MEKLTYVKDISALLVIDRNNDFISEGGKVWDRMKAVAEANQYIPNMRAWWAGKCKAVVQRSTVRTQNSIQEVLR